MNEQKISDAKRLLTELTSCLGSLSDEEAGAALYNESLGSFLASILDRRSLKNYHNTGEYFLANRWRGAIAAYIHRFAFHCYSVRHEQNGVIGFVSPTEYLWFDDGAIVTEGQEQPFAGFICLYRDGEIRAGVAARSIPAYGEMGPDDFEFVSKDDFNKRLAEIPAEQTADLEAPIRELEQLLAEQHEDEAVYQSLLERYSWLFGAMYEAIEPHRKFDDENIPDFTGVRVHDKARDIFEIKQPFMPISQKDGELSTPLLRAWNQAERYLNFARENKVYLQSTKNMVFENPKCYLIAGFKLSEVEVKQIRAKERMNPAIEFRTYSDLLMLAKSTVRLLKDLQTTAEK